MDPTILDKLRELLSHDNDAFFNQGLLLLEDKELSSVEAYYVFGINDEIQSYLKLAAVTAKYEFVPVPKFWSDTHRVLNILGYFAKFQVPWACQMEYLNIPDCNISALPEVLIHLTRLQKLRVSEDLATLPDWLPQFSQLTALDCANCQLSNIDNLQSETLTVLNLSKNRISHLPDDLSGIINVQSLNLSGNPLSDISAVTQLKNLQVLNISHTEVSSIPAEIENIEGITIIR